MEETAPKVSALMKVLSNEHRLMILCLLVEQERSVGDMARALDMRQAALSQQLALLRKDGLVNTRRDAHLARLMTQSHARHGWTILYV